MKSQILTACFLVIVISSFAQNKFGIKIYQNTDIFNTEYYWRNDRSTSVDNLNFKRISLALEMHTKKGYVHEIEFLLPEISKELDNIQYPLKYKFKKDITLDSEGSAYSFRYELSKILTNETKPFSFEFGIGINPYYVDIEYIPNVETTYYSYEKLYGCALNMIPGIRYKVSQRFNIDLNVPLRIYELRGVEHHIKNPSIPIRQQTANGYSHIFFESAYTIRLGLGYIFN
jgi:hypothetical protein